MQATQPGRLLLALIPLLLSTSLAGCGNSMGAGTSGAPTVATPAISPPGGTFSATQTITLTDATPGASIVYTLDGSSPTAPTALAYSGAFNLSQSATLKAVATYPGDMDSAIATATFQITLPQQAAAPTFTPSAGTYTANQYVAIADITSGAAIYYTTNGSTPSTSSAAYTGPITVANSQTIQAIAVATGYTNSPIASAAYVINLPQAAAPTFTPPAGTYSSVQSVTIADVANAAAIYYTTNGSTPTTSSNLYTGPITVSASETIEAIAVAPSYTNSSVASATYSIQLPASTCPNQGPGIICTVAGDGVVGYSGDGGPATSAEIYAPIGVAVDSSGNFYIAAPGSNRIRKVTPSGIISTVAGTGTGGYSGDGMEATSAQVFAPDCVAVDSSGNLYIADSANNRIRKVTPAGIISTVAGTGTVGYSGDGGLATSAELFEPIGIAVDSSGNLYIADTGNNRIRKVTAAGTISTVAGNGTIGFSGDNGPATSAQLNGGYFVAVDAGGNLYIADMLNNRLRKVTAAGTISTIAGNGTAGYSGDGTAAIGAELDHSAGVAVDAIGNLYIADSLNNRIRKITPAGIISTIAGNGTQGFSGDGTSALTAELNDPAGIALDSSGNLYIADNNYRVREVFSSIASAPVVTPPAGTYGAPVDLTIANTTPGASIYYTTDGSAPTTASTLYTGPITISASQTLNAIAAATGYTNSPVTTAAYIIQASASALLPPGDIGTDVGAGVYGSSGDDGPANSAELWQPARVAVDSRGNLFIADSENARGRKVIH